MTEALRQRAPANVLDGEEMKRLEEAAIVLSLPPTARQAGAKHRKRVRSIVIIHLCRHRLRSLILVRSSYELCLIYRGNLEGYVRSLARRVSGTLQATSYKPD